MKFDIHQYDHLEEELDEKLFGKYMQALVDHFLKSKEGLDLLLNDPDAGHWVKVFSDYGYWHLGIFPTQTTQIETKAILTDLFPRKVAISSEEETTGVILELRAFWRYMKREHQVCHAISILRFLKKLEPEFHGIMNDSTRFGMGKSFVSMGTQMGFNMTDETDMQRFMVHYNEHIANTALEPRGIQRILPPREPSKTRNQRKRMRKKKK